MAKILIIEDEEQLRAAISEGLRLDGFDVVEAFDGETGVEKARTELPDIVVSDINMKGMDGYHTLSTLRSDPATANIPFVLMTGRADLKSMRMGMSLGADDYLPKPFRIRELIDVVQARLHKQKAIREEADKKLSELRANISMMLPHELLTPLTGIIGMAEMIVNDAGTLSSGELRDFGQDIKLSGTRLHRLIINFLVYAQIELIASQPERVAALRASDPADVAIPLETVARRKAQEAGRAADLQLLLNPGRAAAPEQYVVKIAEELLDNAFKFSETGTPVVLTCESNGEWTDIRIADQGRGMKAEHVSNIGAYVQFERRVYEQQGSGLGLAIATRLADIHGGKATFESDLGKGTTVTVRLPANAEVLV
jgi:two-component system, sensor histidine kinase and response regulator